MKKPISKKRELPISQQILRIGLIFSLLFLSFGTLISKHSSQAQPNPEQVRIYQLTGTSRVNNLTSSYYGYLQLVLNVTGDHTYRGNLTWHLTWNDGISWQSDSADYTYAENRSYQFSGILLYSGLWITPNLEIGDQIYIDGDPPSTYNFLHTDPFTVTDLVSLEISSGWFLCWQLSYTSSEPQYDTYYFEVHTGILISANLLLLEGNQPIHEVDVELTSASPNPPSINPFIHYWVTYYSQILALIGATMITFFIRYLLRHFHSSPLQTSKLRNLEHNP
ncbi:MAG: hypothetical protein ACXACH_04465 [Candidatus Hermodarchaeia archaeon]